MPDAADLGDPVSHPPPPVLTGGPGSPDGTIGFKPAWRGVLASLAAGLQIAKQGVDHAIQTAEAATTTGVVIDGSTTVTVNFLPACRKGDTLLEAVGSMRS
jgi:uncharacterized Zn-binding protein involved in type VI secretion